MQSKNIHKNVFSLESRPEKSRPEKIYILKKVYIVPHPNFFDSLFYCPRPNELCSQYIYNSSDN